MKSPGRLWILSILMGLSVAIVALVHAYAQEEKGDDRKLKEVFFFLSGEESFPSKKEIDDFLAEGRKDPKSVEIGWRFIRAMSSATLGRLGYGTGPFSWQYGSKEEEAIRRFQGDLSIPVTGKLDSLTLIHLGRATQALEKTRIILPPKFITHAGDYVKAQGTWKCVDCELAFPINTSIVECDRTRGECEVTDAEFISENLGQVSLTSEVYGIVSWPKGGDFIVAELEAPCRRHVLTVNTTTEDVTVGSHDKEACGKTEFKSFTSKLVSGFHDESFKDVESKVYGWKEFYERLLRKNMIGVEW